MLAAFSTAGCGDDVCTSQYTGDTNNTNNTNITVASIGNTMDNDGITDANTAANAQGNTQGNTQGTPTTGGPECVEATDCPPGAPICDNGRCIECNNQTPCDNGCMCQIGFCDPVCPQGDLHDRRFSHWAGMNCDVKIPSSPFETGTIAQEAGVT